MPNLRTWLFGWTGYAGPAIVHPPICKDRRVLLTMQRSGISLGPIGAIRMTMEKATIRLTHETSNFKNLMDRSDVACVQN